jgi:hypothetical protein
MPILALLFSVISAFIITRAADFLPPLLFSWVGLSKWVIGSMLLVFFAWCMDGDNEAF